LGQKGERAIPGIEVDVFEVDAVDENGTGGGIVKTTEKFDEGAFAGAIGTDDGDFFGGTNDEIEMAINVAGGVGVMKADVNKFDFGGTHGSNSLTTADNFVFEIDDLAEIADVIAVFGDTNGIEDEAAEKITSLADGFKIKSEKADGEEV